MNTKKQLMHHLEQLKKALEGEAKAQQPLAELEQLVSAKKWPKPKQEAHKSSPLPLPKEVKKKHQMALFSDGACRGNPGPGAWGALGQNADGEILFEAAGVAFNTTNNVMELEGAYQALKSCREALLQKGPDPNTVEVFIYSDSKYVVDGMSGWIEGWKARGWVTADKKPVKNQPYWQGLDREAQQFFHVHFLWVKGHDGHPQNEYVDQLANKALDDAGL